MRSQMRKKKSMYEINKRKKKVNQQVWKYIKKDGITNIKIDVAQFLFRFLLFSAIEINKLSFGQTNKRFFLNEFFYFIFLLATGTTINEGENLLATTNLMFKDNFTTRLKINILFTIILIINVSELISWLFMKSPLNNQAITAVNIKTIIKEFPNLSYYIFLVVILCIALIFFPFIKHWVKLPKISLILNNFNYIFSFWFLLSIFHDFTNKNKTSLFEENDYTTLIKHKLYEKIDMSAHVVKATKLVKSLILIQLESYSNEFVQNPSVCPNLNNFSKMFEYIGPIYPEPYSTWSTSATILLQTGIPQIIPDTNWNIRGSTNIQYTTNIKGIPDILGSYKYKLQYATRGGNTLMGFDTWVRSRNYKRILTSKNDDDLYDTFTDKYLEIMDNDIRKSNFHNHYLLFIVNVETHSNYAQPKWCNLNFPKIEKNQRCFYCIDYLVGKFVRKFLELKMFEHTLLAVFPDHVPFARNQFGIEPKELFFLFPGMPKVDPQKKINDDINYYDFAPTVLDLIGIKKYVPEFPFGRTIYNPTIEMENKFKTKHHKPDNDVLSIIYKFLHFERGKDVKSHYNLNRTFKCYKEKKNSFYYSDTPCNRTRVL